MKTATYTLFIIAAFAGVMPVSADNDLLLPTRLIKNEQHSFYTKQDVCEHSKKTAPAKKAAPRPAAKKAPTRTPTAKAPSRAPAAQPMAAGDWTMPTAFFPGLAALQPTAAPPAKPKAAAKKGGVRKTSPLKPAARKTAAAKSTRRR